MPSGNFSGWDIYENFQRVCAYNEIQHRAYSPLFQLGIKVGRHRYSDANVQRLSLQVQIRGARRDQIRSHHNFVKKRA